MGLNLGPPSLLTTTCKQKEGIGIVLGSTAKNDKDIWLQDYHEALYELDVEYPGINEGIDAG